MLLLFLPVSARCSSISFSPGFGQPGNLVTITGSGFASATAVQFNTNTPVLADFTNLSDTIIQAIVPPGATIGALGVMEGSSILASTSNFLAAPTISFFSPQSGASPALVYITGANFISNGTTVYFPGVAAGVKGTYVAATEVAAQVPIGAGNGPLTVTTSAGTCVSASNFLASSLPTISSISPSLATNGQMVDIFGGNFFSPVTVKFGTTAASGPVIVSTTEISVAVPNGASGSNVIVTTPKGSATNSNFLTANGALITGFTPAFGPTNTYVNIGGVGMEAVTNVTFNGHKEEILAYNPTNLEVYLSNSAGVGPIEVFTKSNSFTSTANFTNSSLPLITDFNPVLGAAGAIVVIDGLNFGTAPQVKFGGFTASATVTGQGAQISATVPNAALGNYAIEVITSAGSSTTSSNFTITGPGPVITSLDPAFGVRGATVTIHGANFANLSAASVKFNNAVASYQPPTATSQLIATVPADVTSGYVTVSNANGVGASPLFFYMQPWITSLSASSGIVNAALTITGRSLTNTSALRINGVDFTNITATASRIIAVIPSNASSGQIEITTPGGTFLSTNTFAILPKIYSFSPTIGPAGTVVTISGTSLFDVTSVQFGGVGTANFTAGTNQVQVVVPANAASGPLTVVTPYGSDVSSNSFIATQSSTAQLTKTSIPLVAGPGTNITYLLLVTNEGPTIITSTVVTDTLPASFIFASASTAAGTWVYTNGGVIWNIGLLTNNTSASLNINGTSAGATALTNSAALAFAEGNLAPFQNFASVVNYFVTAAQRTLSIAREANTNIIIVTWPLSPANFLLQINTGSNLNAGWIYPTNPVTVNNFLNTYTNSITAQQTFFRLAPP